jgi:hypothetical protein
MDCQYSAYKCTNTADTLIINVLDSGISELCDITKPIIGDVWACTDAPTTPLIATLSSTVEIGTQSAIALHDSFYIVWTIGVMTLLALGVFTALFYMRGRNL